MLEDTAADEVLDLAAGTGLATEQLLKLGTIRRIVAVDADDRMLQHMPAAVREQVEVAHGTAEDIPLPDSSLDAVIVSCAWQWFQPEPAEREIARVLRPGGTLGLLWNTWDRTVPWMRDLHGLLPTREWPHTPPGTFQPATDAWTPPEPLVHTWHWTLPPARFVHALTTFSAVLRMDTAERAALVATLTDAVDRQFPGASTIDVPVRTTAFRTTSTVDESVPARRD